MKKILLAASLIATLLTAVSCYEDYIEDYTDPRIGFALPRQSRAVLQDRNAVYVGVTIGGKRNVDMNDWATFDIDETLLDGTGRTLLPSDYYYFVDKDGNVTTDKTFRVRRQTLAVADIQISFTDAFYADPASLKKTYALPLVVTGTSIPAPADSAALYPNGMILERTDAVGGDRTLISFYYINEYSGTYYRLGRYGEEDASGNVATWTEYSTTENYRWNYTTSAPTVAMTTVGRYKLRHPGVGGQTSGALVLTLDASSSGDSAVTVEGEGVTVSNASGTLYTTGVSYTNPYGTTKKYTFYGGDEIAPVFDLKYTYTSGGKNYRAEEQLILRQWVEYELHVDTAR